MNQNFSLIKTNEVDITLYKDNIAKEFNIYKIISHRKPSESFFYNMYQIFETFIKHNHSYFAIVQKDISIPFFDEVATITKVDIKKIDDIIIARLLIRSLPFLIAKKLGIGAENVPLATPGGLHYFLGFADKNGKVAKTLRVDFEKEGEKILLIFRARSATKGKFLSKKRRSKKISFVVEGNKLLKTKNMNEDCYYLVSSSPNQKITVYFYDFKNFEKTKVGGLALFFKEHSLFLSQYMHISLKSRTLERFKVKLDSQVKVKTIAKKALMQKIVIVDRSEKGYAQKLRDFLKEMATQEKIDNITIEDEPYSEALNLLIVQDEAYYKNCEDPYKSIKAKYPHAAIQALTCKSIDSIKNKESPLLQTVLKELYLKYCLMQKRIDFWDNDEMFFVLKHKERELPLMLYGLHIDKNGIMNFFESEKIPYKSIIEEFMAESDAKYLVFNVTQNESIKVYDTKKQPLPDIDILYKEHEKLKRFLSLSINEKRELIEEFLKNIDCKNPQIYYEWLKNPRVKIVKEPNYKDFKKFLLQKGYRVGTDRIREDDSLLAYLKYIRVDEENGEYYAHTAKSLQTKISRIPKIRKVSEVKRWYFNLLEVGFVRYDDITVLPYPFKFLREYVQQTLETIKF